MHRETEELIPGDIRLDQVRGIFARAAERIDPEDAAYLFATGKSELEIRNALALHLHHSLPPGQLAIREWKRHDFAVLDEDQRPIMVIEGKVWIHTDAISDKKLNKGKRSIKAAIENDLRKLAKTNDKYPDVSSFITIVLFSIDVDRVISVSDQSEIVKYQALHRRGLNEKASLENLMREGHSELIRLMDKYGETISLPLWEGSFHGMRVKSELFVMKPEATLLAEYGRK